MTRTALLAVCSSLLSAQTTIYLRASGPAAATISGWTTGSPGTLTTLIAHGLAAGDVVEIAGVCTGTAAIIPSPINGIRKVAASPAPTSTTFAITDLSNVSVNDPNAYANCGAATGQPDSAKWVGKLTAYTLGAGPLGWLDGPTGTLTRKLALGTANGLTSLVVASNVATVTTSYNHGITTGDKVGVFGSGNTALNTGNGVGAGTAYTVTVTDATHFTFPTAGVSNGTYSGVNNACGPASTPNDTIGGSQDCLRISQLAYVGNPFWDSAIENSNADFTSSQGFTGPNVYKFIPDGGVTIPGCCLYAIPLQFMNAAVRFLVDQSNAKMLEVSIYALKSITRYEGVNFVCYAPFQGCGTNDVGYAAELMEGLSFSYMAARDYLSTATKTTFLDQMYNDFDDPTVTLANRSHGDMTNDLHNKVLAGGLAQAGSSTTITLSASDAQADGYYVGTVVQIFPLPGGLVYGTYTSGITTTGSAGQTCVLTGFNGGGSGASATVALTGTNTIATGTPLYVIQTFATKYASNPTTATATSGSAACSGTASVSTVAGLSQQSTQGFWGSVTAYVASTKVATVTSWVGGEIPASGMGYRIYGTASWSTLALRASATVTGVHTTWNTPGASDEVHVGDGIAAGNTWGVATGLYPGSTIAYVTAVNSDTSLTVTNGDLVSSGGGASTTVPSIAWIEPAWQTGDAGFVPWNKHQLAFPGSQPSIYTMQGGSAASWPPNPAQGGNNNTAINLAFLMLGLSAAPDDARAIKMLAQVQSNAFDYYLAHYMAYNTGPLHSGAVYSQGVRVDLGYFANALQRSIPTYPSLDLSGNWMKSGVLFKLYGWLPDLRTQSGVQSIMPAPYGGEDGVLQLINNPPLTTGWLIDPYFANNITTNESKWMRWQIESLTNNMWTKANTDHAHLYEAPIALLNNDPRIGSVDFRSALPHQYAFISGSNTACAALTGWPCPTAFGGHSVISRTGFSNRTDSLLFYTSRAYSGDHQIPDAGSLQLFKVGGLISCDCLPGIYAAIGSPWNMVESGDMLNVGNTRSNVKPGTNNPGTAPIVRWGSGNHGSFDPLYGDQDSRYAYMMSDLSGMYLAPMNYAQRSIVHLKDQTINGGTGEEVIIDYISADVTGNPTSLDIHTHYAMNGQNLLAQDGGVGYYYDEGATTCPGTGGCASLNTNREIRSLENGAGPDTNPQRKYGVLSKFFSPSTITVRDDSPEVTVSSVTAGNPTVFNAPANGIATVASISTLTAGNPTLIVTATPHQLVNGQYVQIGGVTAGTCNINQYFATNSAYVATVTDPTHLSINYNSAGCTGMTGGQTFGYPPKQISIVGATGPWAVFNTGQGANLAITFIDADHFSVAINSTGLAGSFDGTVQQIYPGGFGFSKRISICSGSACGATVNTFESLSVHKVVQDYTTDLTLTATALNPDANWTGVQTLDKVVMLARGGVTHSAMAGFTTTHSGTAQYLFGGLTAGTYTVTIGGSGVAGSPFTVGANDNSLQFESTAGVVSINGSGIAPPTIVLAPSSMTFSATAGQSAGSQNLSISSSGAPLDQWSASKTQTWTTLSASSGSAAATISITVTCAALSAGSYSDTVTVTSTTASVTNSPQTMAISLTCTSTGTPTLTLSPSTLSYSCVSGGSNPANQTVAVGATNVTLDQWTASKGQSWLTLSPTSNTVAGNITASVNCTGQSVGTHTDTISVSSTTAGITNSPQTVGVSLVVSAAPATPTKFGGRVIITGAPVIH